MKRIILKLASFSVLIASGIFMIQGTPAAAALTSCWETAYNKWNACDGAYSETVGNYQIQNAYCQSASSTTCSASTNSTCNTEATNACVNAPNPTACFNTVHDSCCYTHNYNDCLATVNENYSNRGNSYASCLGFEGNLGNCIEQMQNGCAAAASRVSVCAALYSSTEDADAYWTCRNNSGIDQCQ